MNEDYRDLARALGITRYRATRLGKHECRRLLEERMKKNPEEVWPREDPITKRMICQDCWNGLHQVKEKFNHATGKFTGRTCVAYCRCACREQDAQAIADEANKRANRRAYKQGLRDALKDSPLVLPQGKEDVG